MSVEQVCDEGEIETGVASDERGRGEVLATTDVGCVLEDLLGSLTDIVSLER